MLVLVLFSFWLRWRLAREVLLDESAEKYNSQLMGIIIENVGNGRTHSFAASLVSSSSMVSFCLFRLLSIPGKAFTAAMASSKLS